jgi:hypothetical protein
MTAVIDKTFPLSRVPEAIRYLVEGQRGGGKIVHQLYPRYTPVDKPHKRGDGRSSSAAKKADAVFKIAFARHSSRFSRSNSTNRRRSSLDTPGLAPASIWACFTQPRNVSRLMPNCSPTRRHAPVTDSCS